MHHRAFAVDVNFRLKKLFSHILPGKKNEGIP